MTMKTVYVGLSGGVDSSLTAALLKEQGYHVVGVFMKNWTKSIGGFDCPWKEDLQDAKRVAAHLDIDFEVFDFQEQYQQKVVDYMICEYAAGRTPNPDIMCNQEVKFRLFFDIAINQGADYIATGHYAKTREGRLYKASNSAKDQTYFLYRVSSEALTRTLFPIGEFASKKEVRKAAEQRKLATALKKDSQGICFVGKIGIRDFLSQYITTVQGAIKTTEGVEVGTHDGAIFYTIGQRHGLNVGGGLPYYVVGKDMKKNEVYVTTDLNDDVLWRKDVDIQDVHWIHPDDALDEQMLEVRTRYRAPLVKALYLSRSDKRGVISFEEQVRALTPGQSAVFYKGDQCLGGGIIS